MDKNIQTYSAKSSPQCKDRLVIFVFVISFIVLYLNSTYFVGEGVCIDLTCREDRDNKLDEVGSIFRCRSSPVADLFPNSVPHISLKTPYVRDI